MTSVKNKLLLIVAMSTVAATATAVEMTEFKVTTPGVSGKHKFTLTSTDVSKLGTVVVGDSLIYTGELSGADFLVVGVFHADTVAVESGQALKPSTVSSVGSSKEVLFAPL